MFSLRSALEWYNAVGSRLDEVVALELYKGRTPQTVDLDQLDRLLALGVFTALFLVGGGVTAAMAWARTRQGLRLFSATLNELRRDQERLRT